MTGSEQDYIDGTTVIRNLIDRGPAQPHGTTDAVALQEAETFLASTRMVELLQEPVAGDAVLNFGRMREIHRHLFQDVYAWAGEPRRVSMRKGVTDYAEPKEAIALLREQYSALASQNYLRGIQDQSEFTARLAGFWAEINHGHAFREGNTRSQVVFFAQLAKSAGWELDVSRLAPQHPLSSYRAFVDARFEHQAARAAGASSGIDAAGSLAAVLDPLLRPDDSPNGRSRRGVHDHLGVDAPRATAQTGLSAAARNHQRYPELRDAVLNEHLIVSDSSTERGDDDDRQP